MSEKIGICENFGGKCTQVNIEQKISIDEEFKCKECGTKLSEKFKPDSQSLNWRKIITKPVVKLGSILIVLGIFFSVLYQPIKHFIEKKHLPTQCAITLETYFVKVPAVEGKSLLEVKEGRLRNWMNPQELERKLATHEFYIMKDEVSVKHFQIFYDSLPNDKKANFNTNWQLTEDIENPVGYVSYNMVQEYIHWFNQNYLADCKEKKLVNNASLPTLDQWLASLYHYIDLDKESNFTKGKTAKTDFLLKNQVNHLLLNQAEWLRKTNNQCDESQSPITLYSSALGLNYNPNIIESYKCINNTTEKDFIGFRLIIEGKNI